MPNKNGGTGDPPESIRKQRLQTLDLFETSSVKDSIGPHPDDVLEARLQALEASLGRVENKLKLIFGDFVLDNEGRFINIKKL